MTKGALFGLMLVVSALAVPAALAQEAAAPTSQPATKPGKSLRPSPQQAETAPKPTVVLKDGEIPKPRFSVLTHDFGEVLAGKVILFDFEFTNAGNGPLEILQVKPSCGCTTSGDYARVIAPGASGVIPIKVDTARLKGDVSKTVTVHTNALGTDAKVLLTMNGNVKPLFVAEPEKIEFGAMKLTQVAGKTLERSLIVTNQIDRPLELSNPRTANPNFGVELKTLEAGRKYEVTVRIGPRIRSGSNGAYIEIDTNFPETPTLKIPAALWADAPADVMPSQLVIPTTRKAPLSRALFVRNNQVDPIELTDLKSSDPKLTPTMETVTPGFAWRIKVEIPADYQGKSDGDTLSVKTSHPDLPELVVDVFTRDFVSPSGPSRQAGGKRIPAEDEGTPHSH